MIGLRSALFYFFWSGAWSVEPRRATMGGANKRDSEGKESRSKPILELKFWCCA